MVLLVLTFEIIEIPLKTYKRPKNTPKLKIFF